MDSAYLKKTVGDQLAKGIAHVCEALPSDPVEYLALWLLHEIQLEEVKAKRQKEEVEINKLRNQAESINKDKQLEAANLLQNEVRGFLVRNVEKKKKQQEEAERKRVEEEARLSKF